MTHESDTENAGSDRSNPGGSAGLSESATEAIREIVREELHDESGGPNVSRRATLAALGGAGILGGLSGGAAGQSTGGANNMGVGGMSLNVSEDYHIAGDYYAGPASARPANPGSGERVRWDITDAGPNKQTKPTYWDGSQWDTMGLDTDVVSTDRVVHGHERITSDTTLDGKSHYTVDASNSRTETLPDISDEREINIKRDGANTVTIDTADTATVEGSSTLDLTQDGETVTVVYDPDNDNWEVF